MFRVSILVGAIALLLLAACIPVAPTPAPTGTPTPATPITREQALQIALWWTGSLPEVTAVENPRNPVARLMTLREYYELQGEKPHYTSFDGPDTLVWVVQYEGVSYSAGIAPEPRTQANYVVVVIDAQSGRSIESRRPFAPLFPTES